MFRYRLAVGTYVLAVVMIVYVALTDLTAQQRHTWTSACARTVTGIVAILGSIGDEQARDAKFIPVPSDRIGLTGEAYCIAFWR